MTAKKAIQEIFDVAGIKVDGDNPWDIWVHDDRFYSRVLSEGSLGLGESYMDGWWDCDKLDEFFNKILKAKLKGDINSKSFLHNISNMNVKNVYNVSRNVLKIKVMTTQDRKGSKQVVKEHYDLSPKLYESFLDPYNQYTCGYFKGTNSLNKAQEQKLDLICKKLKLSPKDKVLDIGCGWGGFAKFAAKKYGCHVTGISISEEQIKYAKEFCKGLPVKIVNSDYRDFEGKFDKVVSVGMLEHVGAKNYRTYMKKVRGFLKDDGLFLLHTIGGNRSTRSGELWITKYIFRGGMLSSIRQIGKASEKLLVMEDWHNFGVYYDKTLMAWYKNFKKNWDSIKDDYDDRFKRMWEYYLLVCAGAFRARNNQLWQIVFSKNGVKGGYESIR